MKGGCYALIIALAMTVMGFWGGAQGGWTWVTNLSPTEVTCAEYIAERPRGSWLHLTECKADFMETAYEESFGSTEKIWVPVRAVGDESEGPAVIVLQSEDPKLLAWFDSATSGLGDNSDISELLQVMVKFEEKANMDVDGLVLYGFDLDDDEQASIAALGGLADDFIIVQQGESPSLMGALLYFLMGFAGLGLLFLMFMMGDDD